MEQKQNKAYQCSPCTPSIKQNPFRKLKQNSGKSLQAMGVHIVDLTSDANCKKRDAATQTQELEGPKSSTYNCKSPDGQKKGPFSLKILN